MRSLRKADGRFRHKSRDGAGSRVLEVPLNG
jgi:hypothetical protein